MRNAGRSFAVVGLIAGAIGIWVLMPSDDTVVRKRLTKLATLASLQAGDSRLARLAKGERLREFFAQDVEVRFAAESGDVRTFTGRAELMEAITAARASLRKARVQLRDIELKFGADGNSVSAAMLLLVDLDDEKNAIAQGIRMDLRRANGGWFLTRIETVSAQ